MSSCFFLLGLQWQEGPFFGFCSPWFFPVPARTVRILSQSTSELKDLELKQLKLFFTPQTQKERIQFKLVVVLPLNAEFYCTVTRVHTVSTYSVALLSLAAYTKKSHIFLPPSHHPSLSLSPFHLLSGTVILNSCSGLQWKVLFRVANHSFCPCLQHIHFNQIWKKDKQKSFIPQNQTGCLP